MYKVLLIEDDAAMVTLLQTYLELEGFQVVAPQVNSAASLLTAVEEETPDLILMDVHLERVSGLDLMRQLHARPGNGVVPAIMMSGADVRLECLDAGAVDFILKPYMPTDLVQMIRHHLAHAARPGSAH